MHIVSSDAPRYAIRPFPAPMCERCNEPMALNGEYTPTVHCKMTIKREYQCRMCGSARMVRRMAKNV
jgi:hypothetical protein